jgi:hypothetical protein
MTAVGGEADDPRQGVSLNTLAVLLLAEISASGL